MLTVKAKLLAKKIKTAPIKGLLTGFKPFKWLGHLVGCAGSGCLLALNPGLQAAPTGGQIVGGTGQISQSGLHTRVQQHSQLMAIDWQSFNLGSNEQIRFVQPDAQAIALNRILSDNPSQIHGRVDANGHLILVNPRGLIFGPKAVLNVGGLIASGLHIDPNDFINGDYLFHALEGSDGLVVNQGLIQAAVGGNVTLLGRQVVNEGLILAQLGSVNLASGRAAVLSFDKAGLLGVKITEAVLQEELGLDAAVLNSGQIQAAGGRVLLTGSASHDVFSQAVNRGDLHQATSVTVHEDGSFTLSAGSDVVNSGSIDVSQALSETLPHADSPSAAGQIVLLGDNITSSGELRADGHSSDGGHIEIQARDTTLLTNNSHTSARSEQGQGGEIKVLGRKVGLLDQSIVEASGALGGGRIFIGGDYQGQNPYLPNAWRTFVGAGTQLRADALNQGKGGRIIVWADDSTQYYGHLSAKGGAEGGDGGFAEVSGKQGLVYQGWADLSAPRGENGSLLLDPKNITISTDDSSDSFSSPNRYDAFTDLENQTATLKNADLVAQLEGASVVLQANTDIAVAADVVVNAGSNSLELNAGRSITLADNVDIALNGGDFIAIINDDRARNSHRDNGDAVFTMGSGSSIATNGGAIAIDTGTFKKFLGDIEIGDITLTELNTASASGGGDITVTNSTGNIVLNGALNTQALAAGQAGGVITLESTDSSITLNGQLASQGSGAGAGGDVVLTVGDDVNLNNAIQAGTGTITINGDDSQNVFNVAAGISISGSTITFNGGDGDDIFNLGSSLAATINGGDDVDTFHLLASGISVNDINGGNGDDVLIAFDDSLHLTAWTLASDTAGQIDNNGGTVNYQGIDNITPGDGDDRFTFEAGADFNSTLNGQGGTNTLVGHNLENTWQITGANAGSFSNSDLNGGGANSVSFTNIQHLEGGGGIDRFVVSGNGAVASLQGGAGTNYLQGPNQANTWTLSAANQGRLANTNTVDFTQIQHLTGGNAQDDFYLVDKGAEHIDGGADASNTNNTLYAPLGDTNQWQITANDAGALDSASISFSRIGNLRGGNAQDTFTFTASGNLSGLLDGGSGLNDRLDISAINSERTVEIMAAGEAANANLNILNIAILDGSDTAGTSNHTLQGDDVATTWTIDGHNTGSLEANPVSEPSYTLDFSGIGNLSGGNRDDTFQLADGSSITGTIDGGGHDTGDIVDYSLQTGIIRVTVGSAFSGVNHVENIQGNSSNSTLVGDNSTNSWTIDNQNAGSVGTLNFAGFNHLEGGSGQDTFHVSGNGIITGTIEGMGGDDQLNLSLSGTETGNLTFIGGADNDTLTLGGGHNAYQGIYNANPQNLRYTQAGNTYRVNYSELETVNDNLIADTLTVQGDPLVADTLSLNGNSFQVNTATAVNYSNKNNLTVTGQGSSDALSITGTVTVNGTLSLNNLSLPATDASNRLQTHIGDLSLNNVTGDLYLNETDDLNLLALGLNGLLDLQVGGALSDGADLVASNALSLSANSIQLDNNNQLSGPISLISPGSATLNNTTATRLNTVDVQHLNISSSGSISDDNSGSIAVSGVTTLSSGNDIVLDSGNVQLNQVILNGANSVILNESDDLNLSSASVTNSLNLSAGGTLLVGQAQAGNTLSLSAEQIVDNNDSALNLNAATVILRAQNGIGNGNALETQASTLDVRNSGTGNVELDNTGKVTLQALQNNNNTIIFNNDQDIRFQPGSTDAGFSAGTLLMTTETGSFLGVGNPDTNNPDITANAAVFIGFQGTFGTLQRPLVLNVQDSVLIQTRSSLNPIFSPQRPRIVDDRSLLQLNAFDTLNTLSGGQLIEVETLSEVDPAIFTDVRNYNMDQIAVRLPRDQLYEDELEALDEAY